jgi:prevent-host-death family protein
MHIAVNELKVRLSRILADAQEGQSFEITSHNKPIARLIGIPKHPLQALSMAGAVSWNGKKPVFTTPVSLGPGKSVSQTVLEDRG